MNFDFNSRARLQKINFNAFLHPRPYEQTLEYIEASPYERISIVRDFHVQKLELYQNRFSQAIDRIPSHLKASQIKSFIKLEMSKPLVNRFGENISQFSLI